MDSGAPCDSVVSEEDMDAGRDLETSPLIGESTSPRGEVIQEFGKAYEFLSILEMDLARASEKLVNLSSLMMHVSAKESDFESFASEKEDALIHAAETAGEFLFLSGILDSEIKDLDNFMAALQREIYTAREVMPSYKHLGEAVLVMEDKLRDSEESLKQSQEQLEEMRMQSARFQRIITNLEKKEDYDEGLHDSENDDFFCKGTKIPMQTSEQRRHILRMLEKSLARELDLEKKLAESKQAEEELNLRLHYSLQEVFSVEEQMTVIFQRFFEADNTAEVLKGASKDLICHLQSCQLSLDSVMQQSVELQTKLMHITEASNIKEAELIKLKDKVIAAESRAKSAEARHKLLEEANSKLNSELGPLRHKAITADKVDTLERQLKEADIQLQQAIAVVDASEEKQRMLYCTISDMGQVIEDLKSKVSKAERQADSAEEKWITLSETNEELNEELSYLRGRLESLEASMKRTEEVKVATAKDISLRTKMIADLVLQLAIERERLHKQIASLVKENRYLAEKLEEASCQSPVKSHDGVEDEEYLHQRCNEASVSGEAVADGVRESFAAEEPDNVQDDALSNADAHEPAVLKAKLETVRTIDAGRLGLEFFLSTIAVVLAAIAAMCLIQKES